MNFPPTPLEEFKLSDQFSTSVNFYPAGGSRGNLQYNLLHMKLDLSACMHFPSQECVMILTMRPLKFAVGADQDFVLNQVSED